jgi:hypothetical protein
MKTYLIALPTLLPQKGFNCPTILVKAKNEVNAVSVVRHLKPDSNIGNIKEVHY